MTDLDSLWGEDFILPTKEKVKKIKEKISKPKEVKTSVEKQIKSKSLTIEEKLEAITKEVYRVLGKQKDNVIVIRDKQEFHDYVTKCIEVGMVALDTETSGLEPLIDKIWGVCIYCEGLKQAYIPLRHTDLEGNLLPNQLTDADIAEELKRLTDAGTFNCLSNGKFDYQMFKTNCGEEIHIDWDTQIAAKLLDENEKRAGLKEQYIDKIDPEQEKYHIEALFGDPTFYGYVDPEVFALYAATDSMMTYKLTKWQLNKFKDPDLQKVYSLAQNIEMPLVQVLGELELAGMDIDQEYAARLSKKYNENLAKCDEQINAELEKLKPIIDAWKMTSEANARPKTVANRQKKVELNGVEYTYHPKKKEKRTETDAWWEIGETGNRPADSLIPELTKLITSEAKSKAEQLTEPINLASPTQLAILFYDILKAPMVSKKSPRGTGEDELLALKEKLNQPICDLLIERRGYVKLLSTYIDNIPQRAAQYPDGRIRTSFHQYGADTGRLSSGDNRRNLPNFQNVPSHSRDIRPMFKARPGYRICGADYASQEPRTTAHMSQDMAMINAYKEGKDLYSQIAALAFDKSYEDCLEFYPEGTKITIDGNEIVCGHKTHQNKEGKERRSQAKALLLGIEYGRGAASVGEQIGKSKEEAQKLIEDFFHAFPKVKEWIDASIQKAHTLGYVEDVAGRRRHLPDAQLPKYQIIDRNETGGSFNPFLVCSNRKEDSKLVLKYKQLLDKVKYAKEYEKIQADALKEGIEIHSNTGFIAQAERQAVNSIIQGSAASLTKSALLAIYRDPIMKKLGAYLVNTVHDEILIEAPEENAQAAADRLCQLMIDSAKPFIDDVPMGADSYITSNWYADERSVDIRKAFAELLLHEKDIYKAFDQICHDFSEMTPRGLYEILKDNFPHPPSTIDLNSTDGVFIVE